MSLSVMEWPMIVASALAASPSRMRRMYISTSEILADLARSARVWPASDGFGEKVDPALACVFDDFDIGGGFPLNANRSELDVGMLDGNVGAFGDGNFFLER